MRNKWNKFTTLAILLGVLGCGGSGGDGTQDHPSYPMLRQSAPTEPGRTDVLPAGVRESDPALPW